MTDGKLTNFLEGHEGKVRRMRPKSQIPSWLRLVFLVIILGGTVLLLYLLMISEWSIQYFRKNTQSEGVPLISKIRDSWKPIMAGLGSLITFYLTWKWIRVTQEGHFAKRFDNAVNQIGTGDTPIKRAGGIYILQQVAMDSKKFRPRVAEYLNDLVNEFFKAGEPIDPESQPIDLVKALAVLGELQG